jgi:hypothetical protein
MVDCYRHWVAIHHGQSSTIHHFFVDGWVVAIHEMEVSSIDHPSCRHGMALMDGWMDGWSIAIATGWPSHCHGQSINFIVDGWQPSMTWRPRPSTIHPPSCRHGMAMMVGCHWVAIALPWITIDNPSLFCRWVAAIHPSMTWRPWPSTIYPPSCHGNGNDGRLPWPPVVMPCHEKPSKSIIAAMNFSLKMKDLIKDRCEKSTLARFGGDLELHPVIFAILNGRKNVVFQIVA